MARRRLYDATQTHLYISCPSCGQRYAVFSVMVQDDEEMACTSCNSLFRLRIEDGGITPYLVTPATGAPLGPAEGRRRQ